MKLQRYTLCTVLHEFLVDSALYAIALSKAILDSAESSAPGHRWVKPSGTALSQAVQDSAESSCPGQRWVKLSGIVFHIDVFFLNTITTRGQTRNFMGRLILKKFWPHPRKTCIKMCFFVRKLTRTNGCNIMSLCPCRFFRVQIFHYLKNICIVVILFYSRRRSGCG